MASGRADSHKAVMDRMKRREPVLVAALAAILSLLAACSGEQAESPEAGRSVTPPGGAWLSPPRIGSVTAAGSDLVIRGVTSPGGRVVLRSPVGEAFAASADAEGRFELRMPRPTGDRLLAPEIQNGEDAVPAPERLLILSGGPVALLRPGGASLRLDGAAPLESIDSDGSSLLASGRARPGAQVVVNLGAGPQTVTADSTGRWVSRAAEGGGPVVVTVDGASFAYPGSGGGAVASLTVEPAGAGWRAAWTLPPGASQVSWFPQAAPAETLFSSR